MKCETPLIKIQYWLKLHLHVIDTTYFVHDKKWYSTAHERIETDYSIFTNELFCRIQSKFQAPTTINKNTTTPYSRNLLLISKTWCELLMFSLISGTGRGFTSNFTLIILVYSCKPTYYYVIYLNVISHMLQLLVFVTID